MANNMMAATQGAQAQISVLLLKALGQLGEDDFKGFKWHLKNDTAIEPWQLEKADRRQTVDLLLGLDPQKALDTTITFMRKINRNDLVERLSQVNPGDDLR